MRLNLTNKAGRRERGWPYVLSLMPLMLLQIAMLSFAMLMLFQACNKTVEPISTRTSPMGTLFRYDLQQADYDVLPISTFSVAYNDKGAISDIFIKANQTLESISLSYEGENFTSSLSNTLATQKLSYNESGKPIKLEYTTIIDTGKLVFYYDGSGKLIRLVDSLKKPLRFPIRYEYLYTYDETGSNVVQIIKNELDLVGNPQFIQANTYTFDDKLNPFRVMPFMRFDFNLPGDFPAIINKNNILTTEWVGTVLDRASPSTVAAYRKVPIYKSIRTYEYSSSDYPIKAVEQFDNIQYTFSGRRIFTYEY